MHPTEAHVRRLWLDYRACSCSPHDTARHLHCVTCRAIRDTAMETLEFAARIIDGEALRFGTDPSPVTATLIHTARMLRALKRETR